MPHARRRQFRIGGWGAALCLAAAFTLAACGGRTGPPAPVVDRTGAAAPPLAARPAQALAKTAKPAPRPNRPQSRRRAKPAPAPGVARGSIIRSRAGRYRVRRGDTLYAVSRKKRVPLRALIEANRLRPPYALKAGRSLAVPAIRVYVVARGDTLYSISRRFGAGVNAMVRENDLKGPGFRIHPGGRLILPWTAGRRAPPRRASAPPAPRSRAARTAKTGKSWLDAHPLPKTPRRKDAVPARLARHPPPRAKAKFRWPIKGRVISGFGAKGRGLHNDGINIAARKGTIVRAAENGVVAYAGNELRGYGNLLLIRHADGWVSAYAHNGAILVARGQVVRRGQPVARVGSSGTVTRPQLHFELRRSRRAVNPKRYLARRT